MGDVAMCVPVLRALTQQYPDVKVTVVTRAFFKPFFRDLKNVTVFSADLKGEHKGLLGLYKLSKALRALHFDVVADLHNVLRSKILKAFFIGKTVVQQDKGRAEKKALISGKSFTQLKTTHQRYADVFKALGLPLDLSKSSFPKSIELNQKLKGFINDESKSIIGIAPFAAFKGKMYPIDQMKSVIGILSKDYNIILFGGGQQEIEVLSGLEPSYNNTSSIAGKLSLDEELDIISNLDVMLSMDSGNAHIAAMLGIKVITIWGITHPFAGFSPFNQPKDYALTADRNQYPLIPTSIYGNKQPEGYEEAASSISVETVVETVKSVVFAF